VSFIERRKNNLREVQLALEKRGELTAARREQANSGISRPSVGVSVTVGDLLLVREADSSRHRDHRGRKLQHERYTGPWKATEIIRPGISLEVTMQGRKTRKRRVPTADIKPYHIRNKMGVQRSPRGGSNL